MTDSVTMSPIELSWTAKNSFLVEPNEALLLLLYHILVSGKTKFLRAYPFDGKLTKMIVAC